MKKEKKRLRERLPEFFSKTPVIMAVCAVLFAAFLLLWNFAITALWNLWSSIKNLKAASFIIPNPLHFDFIRFKWPYLIGAVLALLFCLRLAYRMRLSLEPLHSPSQKGSREWSSIEELKQEYRAVPEKTKLYKGKGGFPISRFGDDIFIDDSPVNTLIIGTSRSGKDECLIYSAIDIYSRAKELLDRASLAIADPKGELAAASVPTLQARGYATYVLDLKELDGLSYNPLELVKEAYIRGDTSEAQLLANTISYVMFNDPTARDKTWQNWSIALTNALILAVVIDCCRNAEECQDEAEKQEWYGKINLYSASRLLIDLGEPLPDQPGKAGGYAIDTFFASRGLSDIARIQYAAVATATGKTKGNIFANTLAVLTKFTMEPIARMTARNSIDLKSIGFDKERPSAVFMVTPDYDHSKDFIVTMFISQLYYVLSKNASNAPGGECLREVVFLLDEFGNIPPIPDMANMISVCLGRNIRFDLVVQAYSQIYKLYGQEDGKTILGGCGNHVYLLTIELETAKQFSALIGNETITAMSRCGTPLELDKHITNHIDTQPLLNPNELMELQPGENVVVRVTKRTDLQGRNIRPNPIFNHGKTAMKYRYQYLTKDFPTGRSFGELHISDSCEHKSLELDTIIYSPTIASYNPLDAFFEGLGLEIEELPVKAAEEDHTPFEDLTEQKKEKLLGFLENSGIFIETAGLTMSGFDRLVQELVDNGQISVDQYEDIYTIISERK